MSSSEIKGKVQINLLKCVEEIMEAVTKGTVLNRPCKLGSFKKSMSKVWLPYEKSSLRTERLLDKRK